MKKFILKFKQSISDVLHLKSKPPTIFLGTFVPFFAAHTVAYIDKEVKGEKYFNNFYPYFFLFLGLYSLEIVSLARYFHSVDVFFVLILLGLYLFPNYIITTLSWGIFAYKRK